MHVLVCMVGGQRFCVAARTRSPLHRWILANGYIGEWRIHDWHGWVESSSPDAWRTIGVERPDRADILVY